MVQQHHEFKSYARLCVLEFRVGNSASLLPLGTYLNDWLVVHEFRERLIDRPVRM